MLKDVDYKDAAYVLYDESLCISKRLIPKYELGAFEDKQEDIRRYVIVNPEFHLLAHDGISGPFMSKPHQAAKIIWSGAYLINKDLSLITREDIYECWLDTLKEIQSFMERSGFLSNLSPAVLTLQQAQSEIDLFLDSLRRSS